MTNKYEKVKNGRYVELTSPCSFECPSCAGKVYHLWGLEGVIGNNDFICPCCNKTYHVVFNDSPKPESWTICEWDQSLTKEFNCDMQKELGLIFEAGILKKEEGKVLGWLSDNIW